jgi:hypothetical protein
VRFVDYISHAAGSTENQERKREATQCLSSFNLRLHEGFTAVYNSTSTRDMLGISGFSQQKVWRGSSSNASEVLSKLDLAGQSSIGYNFCKTPAKSVTTAESRRAWATIHSTKGACRV